MSSVDNFLEKLQAISPVQKKKTTFVKRRSIDKIFCGFQGNHGMYQMLPMNNVVTGIPFADLRGTREINMPRKNIAADGNESVYNAWIRILPKEAYNIKDANGNLVSSLSESESELHTKALTIWEELWKETDAYNVPEYQKILIRKKNYTVWNAFVTNYWAIGDNRNPARTNFSATFVVTAKDFLTMVSSNIEETSITDGVGNEDWLDDINNRDLTNRKGLLMFSISKPEGPGFNISVSHKLHMENYLKGVEIPAEDAEAMQNPVECFLGWQANNDTENEPECRHLFNKKLYEELIQYMTDQLVSIRMSKQNGGNLSDAIQATNDMVLKNQTPTDSRGQATNDPVLAEMAAKSSQNSQAVNPENIVEKNTNPFQTPPAAHLDPLSGAPISNSAPTWNKPAFAQGNGNKPF